MTRGEHDPKDLVLHQGPVDPRLPPKGPWVANRSQLWVNATPPPEGCVLVSITQPGKQAYVPEGYLDILRLQFEDFGSPSRAPEGAILFDEDQAADLAAFAWKHRGKNIVVHCVGGISRSGAVVEVLLQQFPEYADAGHEEPGLLRSANPHVRSTLEKALHAQRGAQGREAL